MVFVEARFILFFAIVFVVYWLIPANRWRKLWLLAASYVFYGMGLAFPAAADRLIHWLWYRYDLERAVSHVPALPFTIGTGIAFALFFSVTPRDILPFIYFEF